MGPVGLTYSVRNIACTMSRQFRVFCFLLPVIVCCRPDAARAQRDNFQFYLDTAGLVYTAPPGYTPIDYSGCFSYDKGHMLSLMFHTIRNDERDVAIGIIIKPLFRPDTTSLTYRLFHYDVNHAWLTDIRNEGDSTVAPAFYFDRAQASRLNADTVALYQLRMEKTFVGHYTHCKILVIHKENTGDAEICFFYNDHSGDMVNNEIKTTYGMLKFKIN
jgi:hypothetical protein